MIGPLITYDLARTIHDDRLDKAAQARQINSFKMASAPVQLKKRGRCFTIKDVLGSSKKIILPKS